MMDGASATKNVINHVDLITIGIFNRLSYIHDTRIVKRLSQKILPCPQIYSVVVYVKYVPASCS